MRDAMLGQRLLIAAFGGWNDAGDAASSAAAAIREHLDLVPIAAVDPEDYFDYQFNRPNVRSDDEGNRIIEWPGVTVHGPREQGDVFVLTGTEPSRNWKTFVSEIIETVEDRDIDTVILLGAMLADVPHTRPISIFKGSENDELRQALELERSAYEGPVGILSILAEGCERAGVRTLTVWASVPHYVHSVPSPKATLALLDAITELSGMELPREELVAESAAWEDNIDTLASDDEEMASYIAQLEQARDTVDSPEASGEAIAQEFEKYLRHRGDGGRADGRGRSGP